MSLFKRKAKRSGLRGWFYDMDPSVRVLITEKYKIAHNHGPWQVLSLHLLSKWCSRD